VSVRASEIGSSQADYVISVVSNSSPRDIYILSATLRGSQWPTPGGNWSGGKAWSPPGCSSPFPNREQVFDMPRFCGVFTIVIIFLEF
jgi:hypothetical protein